MVQYLSQALVYLVLKSFCTVFRSYGVEKLYPNEAHIQRIR